MNKTISKYMAENGKKGGTARSLKHKDKLSEWGKMGGRPRKELDSKVKVSLNSAIHTNLLDG